MLTYTLKSADKQEPYLVCGMPKGARCITTVLDFFFCWVSSCLVIVKLFINMKMSKMTQNWAMLAEKWQSHTNGKQMNFICNFITCQHTWVWAHLFIESVLWRSWYLLKRMDLSQDPAAYRKLRANVFILFLLCLNSVAMTDSCSTTKPIWKSITGSLCQAGYKWV